TSTATNILEPVWSGYQGNFRRSGQVPEITTRFIGSGNWNISSNWSDGVVPPLNVPKGYHLVIDPAIGVCEIDSPITLSPGSSLRVVAGKHVILKK
ncbi:MAG: hypothetical protein H0W50_10095, partial [Parachlamydiaceae bacterium]|nr:hypothetical protein [Parachlamydiaceae bacterium]